MTLPDQLNELAKEVKLQFASESRFADVSKQDLQNVFVNKIQSGPVELIKSISGKRYVVGKLWDYNEYIIFAVMPPDDLKIFERFEGKYGRPFPGLIRTKEDSSLLTFDGQNNSVGKLTLVVGDRAAFDVQDDSTFFLYDLGIKATLFQKTLNYVIPLLFCISFGSKIRRYDMAEVFEGLVSKYIAEASGYKISYA